MKQTPDYAGKKILFTAFSVVDGSEELAGYDFIKKYGANDISSLFWGGEAVSEKIPDDVKKIEIENGSFDPHLTEGYDMVFRHQTTRPELIKSPITSNTVEFFRLCDAPIIAVTGTKGKGTTSTLIAKILEAAGKKVHLLGNIGEQAIAHVDEISSDDVVVFEISSFQLWDLTESPHIAVVLMMAEDHLDVHDSIEEYIEAKSNIARHQKVGDLTILHPSNEMSEQVASRGEGKKIKYQTSDAAHVKDRMIFYKDIELMPVREVGLVGEHNLENVCAAVTAAWEYTQDVTSIKTAVSEFTGLEHRLQEVATKKGVRYFNDSFSAATPAASAAIRAFEAPTIAILGGFDKKVSFKGLAESTQGSSLKHALLVGETRHKIAEALNEVGFTDYTILDETSMEEIVNHASEVAESGDVVVLSPGSASFDMFDNYKQRGYLFMEAVHALED